MDDGAPSYRSVSIVAWKKENGIESLEWFGQSPDMNSFENLWNLIKKRLADLENYPKNRDELFAAVLKMWSEIPIATMYDLILSMPRRIQALNSALRGSTKY